MLRAVDRAAFATAFALRLRRAGVAVGLTGVEAFVRGLAECPPETAGSLYWVARVTLAQRHGDLAAFDRVFAEVFSDAAVPVDPHARRRPATPPAGRDDAHARVPSGSGPDEPGQGLPWRTLPPTVGTEETGDPSGLRVPERLPSDLEALADVPFEQLDPAGLALLDDWLAAALRRWPTRRSRRMARHHRGQRPALRPTLERARRTGYEPLELVRTRPVDRPRRVVMLCDVSQSMQHHAAAYFHLMRAVATTADAEVFAFATRLTRLTAILAHRSPDVAIELATAAVTDRFSGTRIATNVRRLLASPHGDKCRGAIVLVASDGWDADPPEQLASAMARLRRRAYRVVWMNPRAAAPGFQPLVGAMAAALPYCDALVPADSIRSLGAVVSAIARSA